MTTQQYDLIPGIDPSGLSAITQAQLLAFGAQAAPFDNIGFIIVGSGAASAHPNVTANPRFVRYIWLDTQTANTVLIKVYQGTYPSDLYSDWQTITIADDSITASKIADYAVSVLNGSGNSKIAYKEDATADATKSNYILRLDAAGQFVEVAPLSAMVAALTLNPAKLDISSASNGWVLQYDSSLGYAVWAALSVSGLISANSLSYDKLLNTIASTNGYILRSNPITGIWEAIVPNDTLNTIFTLRSIRLAALSDNAAVASDSLRFDGTNWVRFTPFYGSVGVLPGSSTAISVAHNLGAQPRVLIGYIINNTGGALNGYAAGSVIGFSALMTRGDDKNALSITANATTISVASNFGSGVGYVIMPAAGGAYADIASAANWTVYAYASL